MATCLCGCGRQFPVLLRGKPRLFAAECPNRFRRGADRARVDYETECDLPPAEIEARYRAALAAIKQRRLERLNAETDFAR
jgi:hypothetical protein